MAFPKGQKNPNAGRPKGAENKATLEIKQAFQNLLEMNTPNMIGWLQEVAADNPAKALDICANLAEFVVPKLARQELTGPGGDAIKVEVVNEASERLSRILEDAATAKAAISPDAAEVDRISPPETTPT